MVQFLELQASPRALDNSLRAVLKEQWQGVRRMCLGLAPSTPFRAPAPSRPPGSTLLGVSQRAGLGEQDAPAGSESSPTQPASSISAADVSVGGNAVGDAMQLLLRSVGTLLTDLELVLDPHSQPELLDPNLGPTMLAACPTLQRLRLQLGPLVDSGLVVRPPPSLYRPLPAAASAAAALLRSIAGLTHLHSLELAGSCWPPLWAELDAPATGLGLASSLLPITALSHLTRLVLGLSADAQDSRRWHVRYGGCCRQLFGPQPGPQPGAQPQHGPEHSASELGPVEGSMFERLLDLDLGMDLALTLPCIPYGATALTRLCVGELTAEWASEGEAVCGGSRLARDGAGWVGRTGMRTGGPCVLRTCYQLLDV